jgi:N-acetylglucosamine-6-phosphate deacetylase
MRLALAAKGPAHVLAITDGTAASGLPVGSRVALGSQAITAGERVALLSDGTWAGSVATMDAAFRLLAGTLGLGPVDAATMCATAPARAVGRHDLGVVAPDASADLVVLDRALSVVQTYVAGRLVYARDRAAALAIG